MNISNNVQNIYIATGIQDIARARSYNHSDYDQSIELGKQTRALDPRNKDVHGEILVHIYGLVRLLLTGK